VHFDNMAAAFLTVFVAVTKEGWVDTMYQVQVTAPSNGSIRRAGSTPCTQCSR
jgi:hypothetical protein